MTASTLGHSDILYADVIMIRVEYGGFMSPPICFAIRDGWNHGSVEGVTGDGAAPFRTRTVYQEQINTRDTRSAMI